MDRIKNLLLVILVVSSCISPDEVEVNTDADLQVLIELLNHQPEVIFGMSYEKKVLVDEQEEIRKLTVDSSFFTYDLEILDGKDLQKIFNQAGYEKNDTKTSVSYMRRKSERSGPISMIIQKTESGDIRSFKILIDEQNLLYRSHAESDFYFDEVGRLDSFSLNGYQKLMGLDTASYSVEGIILLD